MLVNVFFQLKPVQLTSGDFFRPYKFVELLKRAELRSEIEIVYERVLFIPDIDKCCVEPLDHLFYSAQVNVTHYKFVSLMFFVEFSSSLFIEMWYASSKLSR